ncbi:LPS export ABC transporter periplasmic protein LptC [Propionivibrio sp.]|uniref:LPS export ABC transporter periplasmic protein LptC n=1 Tax=Propionivibrio sp. TaxID=2212460 RepID=UPI00260D6EDD|nr:LPS export ABC transporter periplasmic protein LptC [Propionivibrio sp.]
MKQWGSALFPLSLLLALTGLTFWLRYATELPEVRRDGKNRHDPDYIVSDGVLRKLDQTGRLQYTLKASDIRHYPDDDSTDMFKPNLVYLYPKSPTVTLLAERGHANKDGQQIDLYDNVRITRAATATDAAMTGFTPELTVLPDDEKAFTKSQVLITQGKSWVKGVGMKVDTRAQTYVLESQASAVLESRYTKKKNP